MILIKKHNPDPQAPYDYTPVETKYNHLMNCLEDLKEPLGSLLQDVVRDVIELAQQELIVGCNIDIEDFHYTTVFGNVVKYYEPKKEKKE